MLCVSEQKDIQALKVELFVMFPRISAETETAGQKRYLCSFL